MASIGSDESSKAIGFVFPIIGGICVVLRFYSRLHLKNELKTDDWLCIPAWFCVTGTCITLLIRSYRDPKLIADPVAEQHFTAQILGALAIFWAFANTLIKLSVLFFYQRVFVGRAFTICNRILMGLCAVWLIYDVIGWLLYCGTDLRANFEGPWDNCPIWGFELQIGVFALDSLLDFCILILPVPLVWQLRLDFPKKVIVSAIFILGGFAFFAGLSNTIVQGVFLVQPDFAEKASGGGFFKGASILIYNWPAVEVGVGLIACNLPSLSIGVLAALLKQFISVLNGSLSSIRGRTSGWTIKSASRDMSYDHISESGAIESNQLRRLDSKGRRSIFKSVSVFVERSESGTSTV